MTCVWPVAGSLKIDYGGCVASIERVWDAEVRYTNTIEVYEHYS